jgi:hypothetical protein
MTKDADDIAEPTDEERAEAEALARALEPGDVGRDDAAPPADALGAALLLRHAAREPAADRARVEGLAERARPAVDARRPRRWRWALPALLVPTAALGAAALFTFQLRESPPRPPLPAPEAALLEAQARAAHGHADLGELDRRMKTYRAEFLAALAAREGGGR